MFTGPQGVPDWILKIPRDHSTSFELFNKIMVIDIWIQTPNTPPSKRFTENSSQCGVTYRYLEFSLNGCEYDTF